MVAIQGLGVLSRLGCVGEQLQEEVAGWFQCCGLGF